MNQSKVQVVYLLAASHSGSTLTAMLLGSHPDTVTVGELKATSLGDIEKYRCSCKELIKDCSFWNGIEANMKALGQDFDITNAQTDIRSNASEYVLRLMRPLVRGPFIELIRDVLLWLSPNWRRNYPRIQKRNLDYITAIAKQAKVNNIIDSSKIGIRLKYLLKIKEIDVKVVWLTRDGRGVSLAYKNPSEFADAKDPSMRGGGVGRTLEQARNVEMGALEWKRAMEEAEAVVGRLNSDQWIRIKYEDVCNNTEETLDKVFEFIGVDPAKKRLDYRHSGLHVVGNGMRLDSSEEIVLDDRWRTELTKEEKEIFERIAGDMNARLGYEKE